MTYTKKCPKCDEEIPYSTKRAKIYAEKQNTNCVSCSLKGKNHPMYGKSVYDTWSKKYGKEEADKKQKDANKKRSESLKGRKREPFTEEHRINMRDNHSDISGKNNPMYGKSVYDTWSKKYGKEEADKRQKEANDKNGESKLGRNNPMYGKSVYDIWFEKYGKEEADKREVEKSKKISESNKGKKRSEDAKKNYRLSAKKRIEKNKFNGYQFSPNHNPEACKIIDEYNKKNNFNFQHAENGGEVCIDGYWPDGVDEKRKTIIEVDEKHHFNPDGTYKEKDIRRQKYLESLGYTFIRVRI